LAVFKVSLRPDGQEVLEPTTQVKPGDIVEYRAMYRNHSKKTVKEVLATLPIPEGMAYQPNTATPVTVWASLDGKTFAPVPLRREVRLPNGRMKHQDVPYTEYRFLRWDLASLAASQQETVQARVQVSPVHTSVAPEKQ
jgi:uncharacterized repeat protein (TIGR01451 family)